MVGVVGKKVAVPPALARHVLLLAEREELFSWLAKHPDDECTAIIVFREEQEVARFNASLEALVASSTAGGDGPRGTGFDRSPTPDQSPGADPAPMFDPFLPRVSLVACFPDFFPRDPALTRVFDYVLLHPLDNVDLSSLISHVGELRARNYDLRREAYFKSVIAGRVVERLEELKESVASSGEKDFYYAVDNRGIVRLMSRPMAEKLGYKPDEVVGRHFSSFLWKQADTETRAFTERRTGTRRIRGTPVKLKNKQGDYDEFVISAEGVHLPPVQRDAERCPFRAYLGTVGNTSGPQGAEPDIDVFSRSFIPLFIYDAAGGVLQVNKGFEEFSGYRHEEVRNRTPDFFECSEVDGFSFYSRRMEQTRHLVYNTFFIDRAGNRRLCEASIDRIDIGARSFYVGVYNDISGLMKFFETAEILFQLSWAIEKSGSLRELLEKIARRCVSLLEVPFIGIVVKNDRGKLIEHYHLASSESKLDPEELRSAASACLGPHVQRVFKYGKPLSCTRDLLPEKCGFLSEEEAGVFVITPLVTGGGMQGCFITAHPERNAHAAQVLRLLDMICVVITTGIQRYMLEGRLRKSHQELEQRVEERTAELQDFVYTVSHDLKSPLHAARGFTEMIREKLAGQLRTEDDAFMLRRLEENISQCIAMIDHLLILSRLGTSEMEIETVDLKSIIQDYVLEHQALKRQQADIDVQMDGDLPKIRGDRKRLMQLFTNLFDNSIKYRRGSTVSITISARHENGWAEIAVRDNGQGIETEELTKVFKIFYRGRNADHGGAEGTGVGLAIARKIVEQHGGAIRIESRPGEGTTVLLTLPAAGGKAVSPGR